VLLLLLLLFLLLLWVLCWRGPHLTILIPDPPPISNPFRGLHFIIYGCRFEYEFILFMKQVSQASNQMAKTDNQQRPTVVALLLTWPKKFQNLFFLKKG